MEGKKRVWHLLQLWLRNEVSASVGRDEKISTDVEVREPAVN